MYTSGTLEANWWEERVQSSSGTNVGLRVQDRAHHEPPPPMVARERDPSMSATLNGGLDLLACTKRQPQALPRTMHLQEWPMDYTTTSKKGTAFPTEKDSHRRTDLPDVAKKKEGHETKMIMDSTFYEASRPRKLAVTPAKEENPVTEWTTTTSLQMNGGLTSNHPSKKNDTLSRLSEEPTLTHY